MVEEPLFSLKLLTNLERHWNVGSLYYSLFSPSLTKSMAVKIYTLLKY